MNISLKAANLVILASSHNPSIMSPEWLRKYEIIKEDPKQFVHTRDFSLLESESYSLIIDQQRMQISLKIPKENQLPQLAEMGAKYLQLLPHIPYQAVGINFLWHRIAEQGKGLPQIRINIGNENNLANAMGSHDLELGCIICKKKDPYILRLVIEPRGENILSYSFNYHHQLKGGADQAISYVTNISNLYANSEEITGKLV